MMHSSSPVLPTRHHIRNSWPSSFIRANEAWSESNEIVWTTSLASASMLVAVKLSSESTIPRACSQPSCGIKRPLLCLAAQHWFAVISPTGERRRAEAADAPADPVHHRQRGGRALQLLWDAKHPDDLPVVDDARRVHPRQARAGAGGQG